MHFVNFQRHYGHAFVYNFRLHLILSSSNEDIINPRNVAQARY